MTNTERFYNSICSFRKELAALNDKFKPEYDRLERFKDSVSYTSSKQLVDDRRSAELAALRHEYSDRLKSAVDAMEQAYMSRPTSAPSQAQIAVLQALKLREGHVGRDELKRAANNMRGCPVAERVLEEIARKNGVYLDIDQELSEDAVRRHLYSLRRNSEAIVNRLETTDSRKAHVNNSDWTLFRLDTTPANVDDCMRLFALCDDPAQFAAAVNE